MRRQRDNILDTKKYKLKSTTLNLRANQLKTIANEPKNMIVKLKYSVKCKNMTMANAVLSFVEDENKVSVCRDLSKDLGLAVVQQQTENSKSLNNILNSTQRPIKEQWYRYFQV